MIHHKTNLLNLLFLVTTLYVTAQSNLNKSFNYINKLYPNREITSKYHNNWTQEHYKQRIKHFKSNPLKFGNIVFLGNSITEQGRDWNEKFNSVGINNRGIAGDVTDGVLKRLDEITYYKPKTVFILIGINDLFSLHYEDTDKRFKYIKMVPSTKYIAKNILKISKEIRRKSSETIIYVRTILPTRRSFLKDDIITTNNFIKAFESKGVYKVIDLYSEFVDSNGDLIKELTTDGVHLNEDGYEKWSAFEKTLINTFK
ncbi:GDSL-type esterase/lipase family protein [Aestuariibaculum sp. M13]|uniref:GDSL-type esterase/lipase family protein n=1 Tax=Aestuariibaculum sp. M13 TaxID=2967132 RepID=UPI002159E647|nr:GDSL-type esterase/lipase family protein [Aestuariibaculum sp. M13]MCR8666802.1 GDSL-type esterase/lipase family protein [Aestuariibaculum sp. M13]